MSAARDIERAFVLRIVLFNAVTLTATKLPLIAEVAHHIHSGFILLSVLTIAIASLGLVLPVQSPGSIRVCTLDRYSLWEYTTTGIMSSLAHVVFVVAALTYWPLALA